MLETGLQAVGIHPLSEPEGDLLPFYMKVNVALQLTAGAISFYRNRDLTWALVHGLMGPMYLGYLGAKAVSLEETELLASLFER